MPDIMAATTYDPDMDNWKRSGSTYYCYQQFIYWWTDAEGDFWLDLNQKTHLYIENWLAVVMIFASCVLILSIYVYIASVVISVNARRKQNNQLFKYV